MRCSRCTLLDVQELVDLAKINSDKEHHASIHDLERSAHKGCDLCGLILRAFAESTSSMNWYWTDDEGTLLDAVKTWRGDSAIHVSIQADHVYTGEKFGDIRNLDLFQVTAGTAEEYDPVENRSGEDPPTVFLLLSSPSYDPPKLGDIEIGRRPTDRELGSGRNFDIATGWISKCQGSHRNCPRAEPPLLPSRVVDVGSSAAPSCRLLIPGRTIRAHYAALSHCWGGHIAIVLTQDTLSSFQAQLPWDALAANFRDAILITRGLGLRYLWVDSLCIIQDRHDDWAVESGKMASIYRNSLVTISALSSPGSAHGILGNPEPANASPPEKEVTIRLSGHDPTALRVSLFLMGSTEREEDLRGLFINAPLSGRGWCLQESVLPPRILYYGKSRIYWRCADGFKSADGIHPGAKMPDSTFLYPSLSTALLTGRMEGATDRKALLAEYYELVQDFNGKQLTVPPDKLPAFSGVAQRVHDALGGHYLARLWSEDIRAGLLWLKEMRWAGHVAPYRAPSWSWAVTDERVLFYESASGDEEAENMRLIAFDSQPKDESNHYGEVVSAHIVVEGLTMELWRTFEVVDPEEADTQESWVMWDEPFFEGDDNAADWKISRRAVEEQQVESRRPPRLVEVVERTTFFDEGWYRKGLHKVPPRKYMVLLVDKISKGGDRREGGQCLVLERAGAEGLYRRAGLVVLVDYPVERFREWTARTLKIV